MSRGYRAVGWNRQKKIYDTILWLAILGTFSVFVAGTLLLNPDAVRTVEHVLLRGLAVTAFILLHIILSIGPLCRLDPRFLPLLYNRRHMGVSMFILALGHATLALFLHHGLGNEAPLISLFTSNTDWTSLSHFPFQPLGFFALLILFMMAATSHDFWLANLTPPVWKSLHMSVYVAYVLLVLHVALGFLQTETHPALAGALVFGVVWVFGLHVASGWKERRTDWPHEGDTDHDGYVCVGDIRIPENRARIVTLSGDRVAIFRSGKKIWAISNACRHQNGPLGEGCIIDGLVTCPWHGFQYDPATGASPPPFTEKVPTFNVKVVNDMVFVHPVPNPTEPDPAGART